MRVLNAIRRTIMLVLLVPVVMICLDTLLRAFGARTANPIVSTVRSVRDWFVLDPFTDVFPDQNYWQTALVALAAYGLLALVIVSIFRGLRSLISARPPEPRQRSAAPPSRAEPKSEPAAETSESDEPKASEDAQPPTS